MLKSARTSFASSRLPTIATVLWVATIQLIVAEEFAASNWRGYSRITQYVSDLGGAAAPNHLLVNCSIVIAALCLVAGTVIWNRLGVLDPVMTSGLCLSGAGLVILAWFHLDTNPLIHGLAANLAFAFGPITTLYIALYSMRSCTPTILDYIAVIFGVAAAAGWVVHATNIEQYRGLIQRTMELFFLAALITVGFVLRRKALDPQRDTHDNHVPKIGCPEQM